MTLKELINSRRQWLDKHFSYQMLEWTDFDYNILSNIMYRKRAGRGSNITYNDAFIMADTETSKKHNNVTYIAKDGTRKYESVDNYVVAWTISIRALGRNIVTLYGHKPSEFCECLQLMQDHMQGGQTIIYFHNFSYDYIFLRKFLFKKFGFPVKQLNTKPHYPILLEWENGLLIKDSLILAQRSLEKWASDLGVEHQKSVGKWDYDKIRNQAEQFTADELEYIEHDTLAGVECLDKLRIALHKSVYSMPYTATGIPREESREIGKQNSARSRFNSQVMKYDQYRIAENVYHGGYTHANRYFIDTDITDTVKCADFASSYPYVMLSEKYPAEAFTAVGDKSIDYILNHKDDYAFMFKLTMIRPRLKDAHDPMPALQFSKCVRTVNSINDNGRILGADIIEIWLNEIDLSVIWGKYDCDAAMCTDVQVAVKDYLPRWFTDYIFKLFTDKTLLKGGDKVLYNLAKAKLNSLYGMCVQKNIRNNLIEDFVTGEYITDNSDPEELYIQYIKKINVILPYQWGVWVTSYAFYNLFNLGACCETWVYSDTDSCYGINWDDDKLSAYNNQCKEKLKANNYGCVLHNGREYWLGIAESVPLEDEYSEFRVMGAKRYCGRCKADNELHITVAGVPKKTGAKCLKNDIHNFTKGMIFDGITTGKLTHTYIYVEDIYIDENGNETGDSIDLTPCDYKLDAVTVVDWENIFNEEVEVQVYEE